MTSLGAPSLVAGDQGIVADQELMRAAAALVAAAAAERWYAVRWDHDTRDLVVVDKPDGPCRTEHRLRVGSHGRLDELRGGTDWCPLVGSDALRTLAACLGRTDLLLLTPMVGPSHRYRVDADIAPGRPAPPATAVFSCPPAGEGRP